MRAAQRKQKELLTSLRPEHEKAFREAANAGSSEPRPASSEHVQIATTSGNYIFPNYTIGGTQFHVDKAMTELVIDTTTVQHKEVSSHLSAALELTIEDIVKMVAKSPVTMRDIVAASIPHPGFFEPAYTHINSKQLEYNDERAKIVMHCLQFFGTGLKHHRIAVSQQLKTGGNLPTDIFDDVDINPKAYPMSALWSSSHRYSSTHTQ